MRIYTKGGDAGQTGLFGGARVAKSDARVSAYGDIDELNACLGTARAARPPAEVEAVLARAQDQLFTLGSELATPEPDKARSPIPRTQAAWALELEQAIDAIDAELPELRSFILPAGVAPAAQLHLARTVCRRAERAVVALSLQVSVSPEVLRYLNRLSDYLFMAARLANARAQVPDVEWKPPV